jgi:uncharacterized damage-inducible protein DinB
VKALPSPPNPKEGEGRVRVNASLDVRYPMDHRLLLAQLDRDLTSYSDKIKHCVGLLDESQLWWRANERSNSVGNLMLHLSGNLSQWVLNGIGGRPFERQRSMEFSVGGTTREQLIGGLTRVVAECRAVVSGLAEADLLAPRTIQSYSTDGLRALLHAWEHMSYHTGQIVLLTKHLIGDRIEIDFYPQHRGE